MQFALYATIYDAIAIVMRVWNTVLSATAFLLSKESFIGYLTARYVPSEDTFPCYTGKLILVRRISMFTVTYSPSTPFDPGFSISRQRINIDTNQELFI
jgi:hypothetical protein